MNYRHKRTGDTYRYLFSSFSVERQKHSAVYLKVSTGEIFDRDWDAFLNNFEFIGQVQDQIVPRDPNQAELSV